MHFWEYNSLLARRSVVSVVLFLWISVLVQAQHPAAETRGDTASVYEITEIVISMDRHRFSVESSMPAQRLSGRELEKLNSLSVADAVRYFSGVQLKDYGGVGGIKTINVRSLGSAHTAVFYDGMSAGNAQNGQVDLGKYSLDNIEAIELYNGQKSSIFQPARGFFSSNTLFLRSKIPHFNDGENFHLKTSFKTGSFGLVNPSVLYQRKLTQKLTLSASAEWVHAHGRYKYRYRKDGGYDTTAVRQNGDIAAVRAELTLHARMKDKGQTSLKAYFYDSERGLPGAIVANRYSHAQRQWDRNLFVHGSLQQSFSWRYEILANLKFSRDYSRYVDPDYRMLDGTLDNKYYQNELYASFVSKASIIKWLDISLSADFSINTLDADIYRFAYPTRYSYLGVLSGHMKWERIDVQANLLGGYIDERVKNYRQGDSHRVIRPVISASVQPFRTKTFRVRAFYKESFRMPTFNDLYYTFIGNSSLRPEYTGQYNLGAVWVRNLHQKVLRTASVQADVYASHVKDKIVAMPSSNMFRWTMMNLGAVDIKGMEAAANIGVRLPAEAKMDIGLNYTYQHAVDVTPEGTTYGQMIPYTPAHSGTVTASAEWKNFQLNYSFVYTGERYSQKANIPVNYLQPWYTHDMALVWERKIARRNMRVMAEINNLMNHYYDVVLNFPMPGRNCRFSISINL